jgi:hypothetical protein
VLFLCVSIFLKVCGRAKYTNARQSLSSLLKMIPTLAQATSHLSDFSSSSSVSEHAGVGRQAMLSTLPEISDLVSCLISLDMATKCGALVITIFGKKYPERFQDQVC